jgi:hypothetical protein
LSGYAQNVETLSFDVFLSQPVVQMLILLHVHSPVNFDYKLVFIATEVSNVSTDGVLTPKLQSSQLAVPQTRPEKRLSLSLILPKFPGKAKYVRGWF